MNVHQFNVRSIRQNHSHRGRHGGIRRLRSASVFLTLVLALAALTIQSGVPGGSASEASITPAVTATLTQQAAASDTRVEDRSQRTETTQVFANPDGTWTSETAAEPVRVKDSEGDWHQIDPTLVPVDGGFAPRYSVADLTISDGGDKDLVALADGSTDLTFTWNHSLPTPVIDGATATYVNVVPGQNLVVTATATGFEHSLVLTEQPEGPVDFTTGVRAEGAKVTETTNGGAAVTKPDGEVIASIPQPVIYDASEGVRGADAVTVDADLSKTRTGQQELTVTADEAFLTDPSTQYPVTIDPYVQVYDNGDTWIQNEGFTSSQASSSELRAGTYDDGGHTARSYMKFDTQSWSGKTVVDTDLVMYNFYSKTCTAHQITASRIYEPWSLTGLTWANKPSGGGEPAGYAPAYGAPGGTCGGGGYAHWDVDGIVNAWSKGSPNYGIRLIAYNESNSNSWRRYYSDNRPDAPTSQPHLNVTYTVNPVISSMSLTPCVGECDPNYLYSSSLTPTLATVSTDTDSATLSYSWKVRRADTGSVIFSAATTGAQGHVATTTVGAGLLSDEGDFEWSVAASDATSTTTSPWVVLGVDVNQPVLTPANPSLSPCETEACATLVATSTSPVLSETVTDPDDDLVASQVQVRNPTSGIVLASADVGPVPSGAMARYAVPPGLLMNNSTYEFRFSAQDDSGTQWGAWSSFLVSAPVTVRPPTSLRVSPCAEPCSVLASSSTVPTLTADNPTGNGVANLKFEVKSDGFSLSGTATGVADGAPGSWAVPANDLGPGEYQLRAGVDTPDGPVWGGWTTLQIAGDATDTSGFPAVESDPETTAVPTGDPAGDAEDTTTSTYGDADLAALDAQVDSDEVAARVSGYANSNLDPYAAIAIAKKYTPIAWIHPGEKYFLMSATTFINHSTLDWHHYCGTHRVATNPDPFKMGYPSAPYTHRTYNWMINTGNCGVSTDSPYATSKSTELVAPYYNSNLSGSDGMYLNLDNHYLNGMGFQGTEPVYWQWKGSRDLIYWFHWGASETATVLHEGDWERIGIRFNTSMEPVKVAYQHHEDGCTLPWNATTGHSKVPRRNNHPLLWVAKGAHGSYPAGGLVTDSKYGYKDSISGSGSNIWYASANLKPVTAQQWYGYGGAWGRVGPIRLISGPLGPSSWKSGANFGSDPCAMS